MKPSAPMKEETVSQADKKAKKEMEEKDPRSLPTAINLAKNYARAMGAKNPIVMVSTEETEMIDERNKRGKGDSKTQNKCCIQTC
jgi:6-pyruvoyl-tetrahydropterin synthase